MQSDYFVKLERGKGGKKGRKSGRERVREIKRERGPTEGYFFLKCASIKSQ